MDDNLRYQRDRTTVMAIIKYILFACIICLLLYFATRLIVGLIPFLIGFVLAQASRAIANLLMKIKSPKKREPRISSNAASATQKEAKKPNTILRILFPSITKKRRSARTRVTVYVYVLLLLILFAGTFWAISSLLIQGANVVNYVQDLSAEMVENGTTINDISDSITDRISDELSPYLDESSLASVRDNLNTLVDSFGGRILGWIESFGGSLFSLIGSLPFILFCVIAVIMSGFYFITDGKKLMQFFVRNIKSRRFRHRSFTLMNQLSMTLFRVLGGYMTLLIITFVEAWLVFIIAGVKYAAIFALITALLDFLPVLGISATMIPLMIYSAFQGDYMAIVILIIGMAIMTVIRRIIEPAILGKSMDLHPLATLIAMAFGVLIWGPIGFLVGPCVMLIILESMRVFSIDKKLRRFAERIMNKVTEDEDGDDSKQEKASTKSKS